MEIEVQSERKNPLLKRVELRIKIAHQKKKTPTRHEVREAIAKMMNVALDRVVVDHIRTEYGWGVTKGYVKIYDSKDDATAIEKSAILRRNNLIEKKEE